MTVSLRVMGAGDGCKYLLRTVAAGDGERSVSTPLSRYYSAEGTPPGRWLGAGLGTLGEGEAPCRRAGFRGPASVPSRNGTQPDDR